MKTVTTEFSRMILEMAKDLEAVSGVDTFEATTEASLQRQACGGTVRNLGKKHVLP
jgi:hypothetical protein